MLSWKYFELCEVVPDVACFNTAIRSCGLVWEVAILLLHSMMQPDVISYSSAIRACEKAGRWDMALCLVEAMPSRSLEVDLICWSSTISACEKSGCWELAICLLHEKTHGMGSMGSICSMDIITINSALSACEKAGQWRAALQLFSGFLVEVQRDTISLNAVLSACEKAGRWQLAADLLHSASSQRFQADIVSYNAVIASCEDGSWEFALALLGDMAVVSLLADEVTYNAAISAAKRTSWTHALALLYGMESVRIMPDEVSVGSTMTALQHGRNWQSTLSLLRHMRERQVYLSPLVYSVAISTCQLCQQHLHSAALFRHVRWTLLHSSPLGLHRQKSRRLIVMCEGRHAGGSVFAARSQVKYEKSAAAHAITAIIQCTACVQPTRNHGPIVGAPSLQIIASSPTCPSKTVTTDVLRWSEA